MFAKCFRGPQTSACICKLYFAVLKRTQCSTAIFEVVTFYIIIFYSLF